MQLAPLLFFLLRLRRCEVSNVNEVTGTDHDGLCEECDATLTHENLTEGSLGFYCSVKCKDLAEDYPYAPYREDFHAD